MTPVRAARPAVAGAASSGETAIRAGAAVSGAALKVQHELTGRSIVAESGGQQGTAASRGAATGKPGNKISTVMETSFRTATPV